jgi:hypothetical protein
MSRSTTTTGTAPKAAATQPVATQACVLAEKIAMLAYQKWMKGGCKHGNDQKDWMEAEAELKAEMTKTGKTSK